MSEDLRARAMSALREVIDPEIGLNIVDLGLVYGLELAGTNVHARITMTTPACPLGEQIVRDAEEHLRAVPGAGEVRVELVWEPAWGPERMSPEAKETLGWQAP